MANEEETIATLEERISKAVMDCEAWRRTRISESYMAVSYTHLTLPTKA